jgi:hypothetical protein
MKLFRPVGPFVCKPAAIGFVTKPVVTPDLVKSRALSVVNKSFELVAGKSEQEQKKWCADRLREAFETMDTLIPVVGTFMDLPSVDEAEQRIIEQLVEWAWEQHQNPATPTR